MSAAELLKAVDDQRMRLINVLGAIQCVKVAIRYPRDARGRDLLPELDGAIELLGDETQRVINELDPCVLGRREPSAVTGVFTDDDGDRTPLAGLPPALACPFCGKHDDVMITKVSAVTDNREEWFRATCGNCGVDAPGGDSLAIAAEVWNTRGRLHVEEAQP